MRRLVIGVAIAAVLAAAKSTAATPDEFFGVASLHTFELTISAADFRKMPPLSGRGGRGMGGGSFSTGLASDDSGYPKVPATLRFDGAEWGSVHVRYKGNSSYRGAPGILKRSLKIEFDLPDESRTFFGMSKINLNNNAFDSSQMREVVAYDVMRGTGVPAPRTAFAKVYLTVPGQYEHQYAGLFTAVEQIDQAFFKNRWGRKVGLLVKPEGLRGLPDLGDDWQAYAGPYASKVNATSADAARFIAFVRFVGSAASAEFEKHIGDHLDVDAFLRFLAAEVVIVNTDSPLAMNHNYWLTIHPATHKIVWVPWDMNMAFGGFRSGDTDLSLHQPSSPGIFPLADRMLAVPAFRRRYDQIVREMTTSAFAHARLGAEIERAAALIHDAVAADETTGMETFERNVAEHPPANGDVNGSGMFFGGRNGPPLRQFLDDRLESVVEQLDGKREGTPGRGRGFGPPPPRPRSGI